LVHTHVDAENVDWRRVSAEEAPQMAHPERGDVSPVGRPPASSACPIVVSGGGDATVRVWELESGELLYQPLRGHDGGVNALALGQLRRRLGRRSLRARESAPCAA